MDATGGSVGKGLTESGEATGGANVGNGEAIGCPVPESVAAIGGNVGKMAGGKVLTPPLACVGAKIGVFAPGADPPG